MSHVKVLFLLNLADWKVHWLLYLRACACVCVFVCNCQDGGLMTLWMCSRGVANEAYVYGALGLCLLMGNSYRYHRSD